MVVLGLPVVLTEPEVTVEEEELTTDEVVLLLEVLEAWAAVVVVSRPADLILARESDAGGEQAASANKAASPAAAKRCFAPESAVSPAPHSFPDQLAF